MSRHPKVSSFRLVWCLTCYQAIVNNSRIEQKVFLTKRFCFVVRMELEEQTNEIVERIPFVEVRNCRATSMKNSERGFVGTVYTVKIDIFGSFRSHI